MKVRFSFGKFFTDNLFFSFNALALLKAFIGEYPVGMISSIIILVFFFGLVLSGTIKRFNTLMLLYCFINIVSIFDYSFNMQPLSLFFAGVSYNLIPMLLYFIGENFRKERFDRIVDSIFLSNILIIVIGLSIYLYDSNYYFSIMDVNDNYENFFRFGSYLSSLPFGSMCVATIGLAMYKISNGRMRLYEFILCLILLIGLFLNMQRGAWLASGIIVLLSFPKLFKNISFKHKIAISLSVVILVVSFVFILNNYVSEGMLTYFSNRTDAASFSQIYETRSDQKDAALNVFYQYPILGFGLGTAGNKAVDYGLRIAPDGNYFRILAEMGLMGFLCFLLILLMTFRRSFLVFRKSNDAWILGTIVLAFAAHAIGSNVFDFFYSSYIFWFVLGHLNSRVYNNRNYEGLNYSKL